MASYGRAVIRGVQEVNAELAAIKIRTDLATIAALKAMQNAAKRNTKSRMRGRARWDHRGASERTGPTVDLHLSPHHSDRSGGPGKFTGSLSRGVGGVKRPKADGDGTYRGGVGIGGRVTNLYKRQVEGKYPALKPGVEKAAAEGESIWNKAWAKAINK